MRMKKSHITLNKVFFNSLKIFTDKQDIVYLIGSWKMEGNFSLLFYWNLCKGKRRLMLSLPLSLLHTNTHSLFSTSFPCFPFCLLISLSFSTSLPHYLSLPVSFFLITCFQHQLHRAFLVLGNRNFGSSVALTFSIHVSILVIKLWNSIQHSFL